MSPAANNPAPERSAAGPTSSAARLFAIAALVVGVVLLATAVLVAGSMCLPSGDTWIGLASGRLILERGYTNFPRHDEFTWTFAGRTWFNQNWLAHVAIFWLYDRLCPTALVGLKLLALATIGSSLALTAWLLCRQATLALALTAAGLVAGLVLWELRPAMVTRVLVCVLPLVLVLATLHHRLWGLLTLPLLVFWGNAHGGFVLGYAMVGLWLVGELVERRRHRTWHTMTRDAALITALATLASIPLIAATSPFGWQNFTHPLVVLRSPVFQGVFEWHSPVSPHIPPGASRYLPTIRAVFFVTAGTYGLLIVGGLVSRLLVRRALAGVAVALSDAELSGRNRGITLSELALAALATYLAARHIRFTLLFYTLPVPLLCKFLTMRVREWGVLLARNQRVHVRLVGSLLALSLNSLTLVILAALGYPAVRAGYRSTPGHDWREGVFLTQIAAWSQPVRAANFARDNQLSGRLFTRWEWGGYVIFNWPAAKVFIDGRAQALFDEQMYRQYMRLIEAHPPPGTPPRQWGRHLTQLLRYPDHPGAPTAELLLLRRDPPTIANWLNPLVASGSWLPLFWDEGSLLLLHGDATSPGLPAAVAAFRRLSLRWPDDEWGLASRGTAHLFQDPPDYDSALHFYRLAIERHPHAAIYDAALATFRAAGRQAEGLAFFQAQHQRLQRQPELATAESLTLLTDAIRQLAAETR